MAQLNSEIVHVAIPARYESQRLPGKPLLDIVGKPMVVHVYERVSAALPGLDVVVAVDDERVSEILAAAGVPFVMTASTWQSGTDRVAEVARIREWGPTDLVLNVQGDEPLVPGGLLRALVDHSLARPDLAMGTVAVAVESHEELFDANAVKVLTRQDDTAIYFSRAPLPFDRDAAHSEWDLARYRRHVGLYTYRNDVLQRLTTEKPCDLESTERLEQLRALWMGVPIHVLQWNEAPPGGVDTLEDLERVRRHLAASGRRDD